MDHFRQYRRTQIAELRPYQPGDNLDRVSISVADREKGSPKLGDMIARNPKDRGDMWLIEAQYFADNFERKTRLFSLEGCGRGLFVVGVFGLTNSALGLAPMTTGKFLTFAAVGVALGLVKGFIKAWREDKAERAAERKLPDWNKISADLAKRKQS